MREVLVEEVAAQRRGAIKIGPFGSALPRSAMVQEGIKVYGQENLIAQDWSVGNRRVTPKTFDSLRACELHPGDVVIGMMGSLGHCEVFPSDAEPGLMDSHLLRIQPNQGVLTPEYLRLSLLSDETTRQINRLSHGSIMAGLSSKVVRRVRLFVPPLEEQRRIAEILDTIDETIQTNERAIAKRHMILTGLQDSLLELKGGATRTTIGGLVSSPLPGVWGAGAPSVGLREVVGLRATNLDDYGVAYATGARRFVDPVKVAEKRLVGGDLLIEAAGGGPGVPVGRVRRFRQPADGMPYLTSNFFRALRPRAGVNSDYLFWLLDREYRKPSIWSCQQQTTGIINLQIRDYLQRPVSYHQASQGSIARTLDAALGTIEAESRYVQKLREARSSLAADLLSGSVRTVAP